jgi:hypothetical protein
MMEGSGLNPGRIGFRIVEVADDILIQFKTNNKAVTQRRSSRAGHNVVALFSTLSLANHRPQNDRADEVEHGEADEERRVANSGDQRPD